ncbi:hypothetical protein [Actinacidiphila glaucinigra]|uniref:Uncharacterized protein n=1 Tax=Actinacidiphila glaucinigra TaxID=235986 RepID=A0A239NUA1_9ACTN|nr:hypothetical protein [Actinacidiphila glaucinigra]SNT58310.1 hypothetical protein SAMN05216252_14826 [Actinacidiphila glaucinigra]
MNDSPPEHTSREKGTHGRERDTSGTDVLKVVIAQASFFGALMFYVGLTYASQYYGFFHLSPFSLGFGFAELALYSLRLLKLQVIVAAVVVLMVICIPWFSRRLPLPDPASPHATAVRKTASVLQVVFLATGLVLFLRWNDIASYGWAAPLTLAIGITLGQGRAAAAGHRGGPRRRALLLFAIGVCLFWSLTLAAQQMGRDDASTDARHVLEKTGLVVLSANRLSLPLPLQYEQDLGTEYQLRYRYTGLRLLLERGGRYYVVPVDWEPRTDPVYVLRESDTMWIGLMPGVLRTQ